MRVERCLAYSDDKTNHKRVSHQHRARNVISSATSGKPARKAIELLEYLRRQTANEFRRLAHPMAEPTGRMDMKDSWLERHNVAETGRSFSTESGRTPSVSPAHASRSTVVKWQ